MGNQRLAVIIVPIPMTIIAIAAVVLRLTARQMQRIHLGADDYTILGALVRKDSLRSRASCLKWWRWQLFCAVMCIPIILGLFKHGCERSISRLNSNAGATEGTMGQHEPATESGLIMAKHQNSIDAMVCASCYQIKCNCHWHRFLDSLGRAMDCRTRRRIDQNQRSSPL